MKLVFILGTIVVIAGFGFLGYWFFYGQTDQTPETNHDIISEESASPSPTVSNAPQPSSQTKEDDNILLGKNSHLVQTPVARSLITGPATCQLSGSINFMSADTYETKGAKLVYQNVDDSSRLIFWKITPDDGSLKVGPNIFANIKPLPNGETMVGVAPYGKFTSKEYVLTAYITYGVPQPDGSEKIANANCTGQVTVTTP